MSTDRKYFTNHGFHLNKPGKERIGRQIADQIREIVNSVSKKEHTYLSHLKDDHSSGVMRIDDTQSFWSTSCEGNASHLGNRPFQENHTQQDRSILDHIIRMDNDHGKVVMSTKEEMVISNSGSGKVEEVNSELISASAIEQRTLNAKKARGESTQVEDNIDEIMGLCITYSESKNVNEGKHVRVSKSTYDLHSVASTEEDSCVIRERVFENRVFDKGQEVRSELENGSELELGTAKDQKTSAELAQIEVKEDKLRSLCIDNSETKNENESKYITDSKFMNDSQSVSVTKEDHSIIGENELLSADRIKKNMTVV
jgi:hypothetical protein